MSFSPSAKAALRSIGAHDHNFDPNEARDYRGRWTSGGGGVAPAPKTQISIIARDIFTRHYKKRSHKWMVEEARKYGVSDPESQLGALLREARKGQKVTSGFSSGVSSGFTQRDTRTALQVARDEYVKQGATSHNGVVNKVEEALAAEEAHQSPVMMSRHGMPKQEPMYTQKVDHMELHYNPATRRMAATLIAQYSRNRLPVELTMYTDRVYLSVGENIHNPHWERVFSTPGFKAGATGGDGAVVYYHAHEEYAVEHGFATLAHEMGHNLAKGIYGDTQPPASSPVGKLFSEWEKGYAGREPPVSDYGRHTVGESFAEAVKVRYTGGSYARERSPRYMAAVDEAIGKARVVLLKKAGMG